MQVEFPSDIREDIKILGGLKLADLKYLLPSAALGVLSLALPFPAPAKLLLLVGIPLATFLWLFFEAPAAIRRRRSHRKEPEIRTAAENVKNIQEIIAVREAQESFVVTDDQCIHLFLSATPGAWHTKTESEKDLAGFAWAQAVARAVGQGLSLDVWVINDLEVLRAELARQEKAQEALPEPVKQIGKARREYFSHLCESGFSRVSSYIIRLSADPFRLELIPRPRSKGERVERTKEILSEIARDVIDKLRASRAEAVLMSEELVRDAAARQLDPGVHRDGPVRECSWVKQGDENRPQKKTQEKQDKKAGSAVKLRVKVPSIRLAPLLVRIAQPFRRLFLRGKSAINLVVVLKSNRDEMPGLNELVNVLYAEYKMVNTGVWAYSRHDDTLPQDIEKMMRSGYVFAVIPNPDEWRDMDVHKCIDVLESAAKRYGCKVDAALLKASGIPVFLAKEVAR